MAVAMAPASDQQPHGEGTGAGAPWESAPGADPSAGALAPG